MSICLFRPRAAHLSAGRALNLLNQSVCALHLRKIQPRVVPCIPGKVTPRSRACARPARRRPPLPRLATSTSAATPRWSSVATTPLAAARAPVEARYRTGCCSCTPSALLLAALHTSATNLRAFSPGPAYHIATDGYVQVDPPAPQLHVTADPHHARQRAFAGAADERHGASTAAAPSQPARR